MRLYALLCLGALTLTDPAKSLNLVRHTPDFTALEGDDITLYCESDAKWQWCYFENADAGQRWNTYQEAGDEHFQYADNGCGLKLNSVSRSDSGEWKCQLSDTDVEEEANIKAEGFMTMQVATEAIVMLDVEMEEQTALGTNVTIRCSVDDPSAFPAPALSLHKRLLDPEGHEILLVGEALEKVDLVIPLKKNDHGAVFVCRSKQSFSYGNETRVFSSESDYSEPVELVFPPSASDDGPAYFVYDPEVGYVDIPVTFSARPPPSDEMVSWTVSGDIALTAGQELPDLTAANLTLPDESDSSLFVAVLQLRNLIDNATVALIVDNGFGSITREVGVVYAAADAVIDPGDDAGQETVEAGIAVWMIALIAIIGIILLLICMFAVCAAKSFCDKKRKEDTEMDAEEAKRMSMKAENAARLMLREQEMKIFSQTTPMLQPKSPQRSPINPPTFDKSDSADSGRSSIKDSGGADQHLHAGNRQLDLGDGQSRENPPMEISLPVPPLGGDETSRLLSPELVLNQTIVRDTASPALGRGSSLPRASPRPYPEIRHPRNRPSARMRPPPPTEGGVYDSENGGLRFSGPTNYPVLTTFKGGGGENSTANSTDSTPFNNRKLSFMKPEKRNRNSNV